MRKLSVKEKGVKHGSLTGAALATRSIINFKEIGLPNSVWETSLSGIEDLLGANALENWLQVCAEPSEIFCDKVPRC